MENKKSETEVIEQEIVSHSKKNSSKSVLRYYIKIALVILILLGVYYIGLNRGLRDNPFRKQAQPISYTVDKKGVPSDIDFSLFWKVWDILQDKYVDANKITPDEMLYGAIEGLLASSNDPYTTFFDPQENKNFNSDIDGTFEGIGAEIGIKQGILTIIAPLASSPAEKSGLKAGDKILKINGEESVEISILEAVSKIRGEKGTDVTLTIFRNGGESETKEIVVTRGTIKIDSVEFELKDGVPYFKIVRFGDDTDRLFNSFIKKIPTDAPGIIVDVRNNPGGYLESAVNLTSLMLPRGDIVVIETNKDGSEEKIYSKGWDKLSQFKTIVLINQGSASASEILAGALKDNRDNVTIVGEKSFGKGSVQELVNLPFATAAKITVAKWLTPAGNQINKKGITPDVEVKISNEDYENNIDPQLNKAIELIK